MHKRILIFTLLCFVFSIVSACSDNTDTKQIALNFKEPSKFPFEVDEVATEIDIKDVDNWYQFIFYYRNTETTQQINYILSKVNIPSDNKISKDEKSKYKEYQLANGLPAYYEEDSTSRILWWEREDGFLARFVYFINGNTIALGENKLEVEELIQLANQVQERK